MTPSDSTPPSETFYTDIGIAPREINPKGIWDDDCCDRCPLAVELQRFIRAQQSPLTIGLDGTWGSGKTYFLLRFVEQYKSVGKGDKAPLAIYLNAWENDYIQNPLLYLYHNIAKALGERDFIDPETRNTLIENLGYIGLAVADKLLKGVPSKVAELKAKTDAAIAANAISVFEKETNLTRELIDHLTTAAQVVREKTGYPLLVCVDELDRCRPTYAIEMLERVKHCCSIPNVVFVLGIDRRQLGISIQTIYGGIDIENYLRRFIQFPFPLPVAKPAEYLAVLWREAKLGNLANNYIMRLGFTLPVTHGNALEFAILATFKHVINRVGLTMRETEEAVCRYYRVGLGFQLPHLIDFILLAILSVLKVKDPDNRLPGYLSGKDRPVALYHYLFGDSLTGAPERSDMIEAERVCEKIIDCGMATTSDPLVKHYSETSNWPDIKNCEHFHFGNTLAALLKYDLNAFLGGKDPHARFSQSRANALYERLDFHFVEDRGWF